MDVGLTSAQRDAQVETTRDSIDFDLHGIAGIRLLDASPDDVMAVTRQVGLVEHPLSREPDVIVRFVPRLHRTQSLRLLGVDDAAFADDAFLLLRTKDNVRRRVQLAFDQIGHRCEIVAESGVPAVPLLVPILNLVILAKGIVPMHASAFAYRGHGALVTGWTKGGKTETLLAFMQNGATFIGDEWVYVDPENRRLYGIPEPITLWEWHLQQAPTYRGSLLRHERARVRTTNIVSLLSRAIAGRDGAGPITSTLNRVLPILERQLFVNVEPERLFGRGACALSGTANKVFFVVSHEDPKIVVEPIDPREVAARMTFSLQYERREFLSYYLRYRFAFPSRVSALVENAEAQQRELLARAIAGLEAYAVYHPYPVPISELFTKMAPLFP